MSRELEDIYRHIDQNLDEHVVRVQEWIRQPSVSNTGEGIRECAEMTRGYFEELGCQKSEVVDVGVTDVLRLIELLNHPDAYRAALNERK